MNLSLEELKKFLRIDGSEDDDILTFLVNAAKEALKKAGVPETDSDLYKLAVMLHVALYYENRDPGVKMDKLNFAFESIVLQLKDYGGDAS
ncbi:hypothetical protein AT864_01506 [Anoxybacillus sp. P3H1B]|uniref:head-tail connector protein n=1 Tax=Anoxybacillus sp. P3H1B TaxID=1769293 RepID=UPI00079BDD8D|nr:head-tail connector protein [Anoxybacillus sp. P3H1B]KXG09946.1 hypothetical protein AT864_01506 [Anoxybacillus sp. P3H1B]